MSLFQWNRKVFIILPLVLALTFATASSGLAQVGKTTTVGVVRSGVDYKQFELTRPATEQDFGDWVVQTTEGLIQEASVCDNNKLEVVLTPQVRPKEVQPLMRSLVRSFQHSFPHQDLTVLMYSSNKRLILTARADKGDIKLRLH